MRVLHLVDDEKFIDGVINTFRELGVESRFVVLCSERFSFGYVKQADCVDQVLIGSDEYNNLLSDNWPDYVWVHLLGPKKAEFVVRKTSRAKIIWSSWGADNYSCVPIPLFLGETFAQWLKTPYGGSVLGRIKVILRELRILRLLPVLPYYLLCSKVIRRFLSRVAYFSTIVDEEEKLVRRVLGNRPQYIHFAYTDLSHPIPKPADSNIYGYDCNDEINIWVGNSATWTNNTFDAIRKIASLKNIGNVYAPLSYGDATVPIDSYGKKVLGDKWHPLKSFVPLEEYQKMIGSCQVFVFNHLRQQALGNVLLALSAGGCVFLQNSNPIYNYLHKRGIKVYSFDELDHLQSVLVAHGKYALSNKNIVYQARLFTRRVLEETMSVLERGVGHE